MVYINNKKLDSIKLHDNDFSVILDFDRTITTSNCTNSWSILENPNFMNPEFQVASTNLMNKYFPLEIDFSLDKETKASYMQEWYSKNMNLFYKYGLTYDILLNCVKHSDNKFRVGFKDFLHDLFIKNIPVVILSAGIGNVIEELLKLNDCFYDNISIVSNFIKFKDNLMLPFEDKIIHSSNKCLDAKFNDTIFNKNYILVFGDVIEDLHMIPNNYLNKAISFGFLEINVKENLDLFRNTFDVVLTDNSSFYDVKNVLDNLRND